MYMNQRVKPGTRGLGLHFRPRDEDEWHLLTLGWRELFLGPVAITGGGDGGGTGPVVPRRTASQMQRGSGELQSTPTGFWKLQSDPTGAGQGSIAAGIGAQGSLRSACLTVHMGCSHTHTHTHSGNHARSQTQKILKVQSSQREEAVVVGGSSAASSGILRSLPQASVGPISWFQASALTAEPLESLIPQVPHHSLSLLTSESQTLNTHPLSEGVQSGGGRRQAPGQQMEECVWQWDQR